MNFETFIQQHSELEGLEYSTQLEAYNMWLEQHQMSLTEADY